MPITCRVVSPERPLFEGEVERLVAPGALGELGIWPLHAPLISRLAPGVVRLHSAGGVEKMAVRGGFIQVLNDDVTMLVTRAIRSSDVDPEATKKELADVKAELQHPASDERYQELLDRRQWLETCLKVYEAPQLIQR